MIKSVIRFTVLFDEPFWVGVFERNCKNSYDVCKITFGTEPKETDLYGFILQHWDELLFSRCIETEIAEERRVNPKRAKREAQKAVVQTGIGTKAQQALKQQYEQNKADRKTRSKALREQNETRKFELHKAKRKEKHKGH